MNWHYVDQGQRAGPVNDAQLIKLLEVGTITADTLVWSLGGYRPSDFPVRLFYGKRGVDGMAPLPAFQFDRYCEPRTALRPGEFWGPNRSVFYRRLAYEIFQ